MFTTSFTSLRRLSGCVLPLLLSSVCVCAEVAAAQSPLVVSGNAVAVPHNESYGAPWQSAVTNRGDFVLFDFKTTGMYEYPANGGAEVTLAAPGVIAGGFSDSGIAIDPRNNNIYLNNNYNGGLIEYPFDPATGTWDLPSVVVANGLSGNLGGVCGNYFQSAGMSMNHNGILAVATENGCGVEIFTVPVDASGTFGAATAIVSNMTKRAKTVAIDDAGNISFNEDSGGIAGALFIPSGTTGLADDSAVLSFFNTMPTYDANGKVTNPGNNVQGVTVDTSGNLYVVDGNYGAYLVPLVSGVPTPAAAILLSTVPANGGPSFDQTRGVLFYPTTGSGTIKDLVDVYINRAELGTVAVPASAATAGTVSYYFTGDTTPYTFTLVQDGSSSPFTVAMSDLAACGITFTLDKNNNSVETATTYHAGGSCTLPVSFTPTTVGDASATLLMQDQSGNTLSSITLHGVGQASAAIVGPGLESAIGAALVTPSQIAVDVSGNVYVADSGQGKVLVFAKGATAATAPTTVGTGLTAPTGVAVDGTGDVFIADSGSVFKVPYGAAGLNAAGQTTVKSGLGTNLKLAADAVGDLYIADPDNQQVERLRNLVTGANETDVTGFTQLSAIAADGEGDLFVANGTNLIEVTASYQKTLLTSLSGANGLAVDASGAAYVSQTAGTVRIPNVAGALTPGSQTAIALGATGPTSVAVDLLGNAYVADGTAKDVDMVSASGLLNFGTLTTTTSMQTGTATIISSGNAPLNISGFSSTADYTETATTCVGSPVAVGTSCAATITFNPGPGDQGTLTGMLAVQGDAANSPVDIDVTGVGAALAVSTTTLTVTNPTVTSAPVTVTVASKLGTGPTPTGNVNLVLTATGMKTITFTAPLVNGAVSFNAQDIQAGTYTFTANYIGDRVYGTSTASQSVTIASGTVMLIQPDPSTVPTYVLADGTGSAEPFDGSQIPYYYNYPVIVKSADGNPLIGVPIYNAAGTQLGTDYGTVSYLLSNGTAACQGTPVNADGTAPLPTNCFTINTSNNQIPNLTTTYTVTPVYTGNSASDYATSMGTPVTFIALRNPAVIITSSPASLSVPTGASASATLTLTSLLGYGVAGAAGTLNNYGLPLELECDNLPAHASCTFTYPTPDASDPNSVDVNVNAPGTVMMTVNTNIAVGTTPNASIAQTPVIFAVLFGTGVFGLAFGRKKLLGISLMKAIALLLFTGAAFGLVACSSKDISVTPMLTTPAGTYTVTVTAKQAGSITVLNSQGVPVAVQGNGNQMSIPFTMSVVVQ